MKSNGTFAVVLNELLDPRNFASPKRIAQTHIQEILLSILAIRSVCAPLMLHSTGDTAKALEQRFDRTKSRRLYIVLWLLCLELSVTRDSR